MPFTINGIKFVPQLFYRFLALPFGIQSTQIHINNWSNEDFKTFKNFIKKKIEKSLLQLILHFR